MRICTVCRNMSQCNQRDKYLNYKFDRYDVQVFRMITVMSQNEFKIWVVLSKSLLIYCNLILSNKPMEEVPKVFRCCMSEDLLRRSIWWWFWDNFPYLYIKMYVVGTHWGVLLMSIHIIAFMENWTKLLQIYCQILLLKSSGVYTRMCCKISWKPAFQIL